MTTEKCFFFGFFFKQRGREKARVARTDFRSLLLFGALSSCPLLRAGNWGKEKEGETSENQRERER